MDKLVSMKHTMEREFMGCDGHAALILMELYSLQMCLHVHSTLQSYILSYRDAQHENVTFSILVRWRQEGINLKVLIGRYQIWMGMEVLIKASYTHDCQVASCTQYLNELQGKFWKYSIVQQFMFLLIDDGSSELALGTQVSFFTIKSY